MSRPGAGIAYQASNFVRKLVFMLWLILAGLVVQAQETNYFCVLCGKGPLTGRFWMSKWGAICNDCYSNSENRCSICGIPITEGYVQTSDGRYICKFDKPNAVLDVDQARDLFADTRSDLVQVIGSGFALQYPTVTVNMFDVDYWSETGRDDGLHKFGFAYSRRTPKGEWKHEVVILSGRLRGEMSATEAHEYTHLWISENCPESHEIAKDTLEGICELCSYKLMESRGDTNEEQRILANPYTHGEIVKLVALEQDKGMAYILDWVKNGTSATLEDADAPAVAASTAPMRIPMLDYTNVPPPLPATLRLAGLMTGGQSRQAIVSGASFQVGDRRTIKLTTGTVQVQCLDIERDEVVLKVDGVPDLITLKMGEEKALP
jgi:hypothetical protein